jgi:crossover junction endodeoxyribonuclease RuvC
VIVLGVDPGSTVTGYGVVATATAGPPRLLECGVVRAPAARSMPERLAIIHAAIVALIQRHRPTVLAIETVFVSHNARSALVLGQARGVVVLAAAQADLLLAEYAPRAIKQAVTGTGAATKVQVQHMTARLLRLAAPPTPADAADGVAIALTHCLRTGRPLRRAVIG